MTNRVLCLNCEYILARCLCHTLRPIHNQTHIIALQHPTETNHALNTVRLMKKSFQQISLFVGENFSDHSELNNIIKNHKETLGLIFPDGKKKFLNSTVEKKITHLILIDGSWKKARKIYLLSTNLHDLMTISLESPNFSQYTIRQSKTKNSLSSLEAAILTLKYVEEKLDTSSLENSFLKMIEFQIEKMGVEIFQKNYVNKNKSDV